MSWSDLSDEMFYPAVAGVAASAKPSEIECEVIGLFDQFRSPMLRYALSFGLSSHDAEEVVQEVFFSLFRHLQAEKSRQNLRGWLFRVTHNLALKQRQENHRTIEYIGPTRRLDDAAMMESHPDESPTPEQRFSLIQRWNRLLAIVAGLPEDDRQCLHLRAEGLRYREIATVLGISLGSVSNSLARSLARLARAKEIR